MRRFLVVLLLTALSFQQGLKLGVVTWWTLNRTRIARTRCENRNRPQLNCCGRCVLNKQLRKTDGPEKSPARQVQKAGKEEPAVITDPAFFYSIMSLASADGSGFPVPAIPSLLQGSTPAPFQPPRA